MMWKVISKDQMIPKEPYRVGDNIKALIIGVNKEKGPFVGGFQNIA